MERQVRTHCGHPSCCLAAGRNDRKRTNRERLANPYCCNKVTNGVGLSNHRRIPNPPADSPTHEDGSTLSASIRTDPMGPWITEWEETPGRIPHRISLARQKLPSSLTRTPFGNRLHRRPLAPPSCISAQYSLHLTIFPRAHQYWLLGQPGASQVPSLRVDRRFPTR